VKPEVKVLVKRLDCMKISKKISAKMHIYDVWLYSNTTKHATQAISLTNK
jgi:hypothetical protein